ncbi:uncharacterized protein BO95DRAFT_50041 [Aspergillus brunneoviolaceus CBS 621.78]|uniref:Uncharacterized protein n=1 Tax=Aspergillus brunneoviolaceus CBS 621.78 TaxID=1450534 RepID=A0ACD1GH38_9EURO|nr:hypothetical protein BO95DRAFT_50041 [Aspergillus brunneoviolaceus CBS 621.78]RAH48487.1 hypothetical protein BO95DRAFT_50041 [Aspergillus brunneoviolaceus CBS 621.78]
MGNSSSPLIVQGWSIYRCSLVQYRTDTSTLKEPHIVQRDFFCFIFLLGNSLQGPGNTLCGFWDLLENQSARLEGYTRWIDIHENIHAHMRIYTEIIYISTKVMINILQMTKSPFHFVFPSPSPSPATLITYSGGRGEGKGREGKGREGKVL